MLSKCLSRMILFAVFQSAASIQRQQARSSFDVSISTCETCLLAASCQSLKTQREGADADDGKTTCYETCKDKEGEEFDDWLDLGCPSEDGQSPCDLCVFKLNGDGDISTQTCNSLSVEKDSEDLSTCYSTCLAEDGDNFLSFMELHCQASSAEKVEPPCDNTTGTCTVMEDPHITVFDEAQVSLISAISADTSSVADALGNGRIGGNIADKWLVKTPRVSIQARFGANPESTESDVLVRSVAIGGSFLGGSVIVIGPLEENVTFNGEPVLREQTSSFESGSDNYSVKAERTLNASQVGNLSQQNPGVILNLPLNINLIVNRLHGHVNVAITMSPQSDGQDGLCGNFNGIGSDDSLEFTSSRMDLNVLEGEALFANTESLETDPSIFAPPAAEEETPFVNTESPETVPSVFAPQAAEDAELQLLAFSHSKDVQ